MSTPEHPEFTLSPTGPWRGLQPGMKRAEVMAVLEKAQEQIAAPQSTPDLLVLQSWGMELQFEEDSPEPTQAVLRQIVLEDERYLWNGQPIMEQPLHRVLRALSDVSAGASWRAEDAASEPDGSVPLPALGSITDEALLNEGTLWLPSVRLGLVMTGGTVSDLVWRCEADMPREFLGRITPEQMELSRRPDLQDYLFEHWRKLHASPPSTPTPRRNALEGALALIFVIAISVIAWSGWQEMRAWQQAAVLQGTLVGIDPPATPKAQPVYHIEFKDPSGRTQTVALERAEFYIAPTGSGDTVPLAYVDADPPRVKGLARAKDSAFLTYFPWAAGVALGYTMLKLALTFFSTRARNRRSKLPILLS